jgi:hypothetical protein
MGLRRPVSSRHDNRIFRKINYFRGFFGAADQTKAPPPKGGGAFFPHFIRLIFRVSPREPAISRYT